MGSIGAVVYAWVLLAIFIAVMLWLGGVGAKTTKTIAGFAIAKGTVRPWMLAICFAATYASANLFIGVPGWAYSYGESVLWWTWGCFGLSWIGIILLTKKFYQIGQEAGGSITLAEWLAVRYNSTFLRVGVALLWCLGIYYIAGQTVGMGTLFESTLGLPYIWGAILGTIIVVIYIGVGGTYADIITDTIQGILMMVFGVLTLLSLAWTIGGGLGFLGVLHSKLAAIDPALVAAFNAKNKMFGDPLGLLGIELLLFAFIMLPQLINKVLTLKDEGEMREFLIWSGIGLFFVSNCMVFGGLAARVLIPNLKVADSAIPQYLLTAFNPYIGILIVIAILAAVLSTTDGLYVSISSQLANDVFRKWLGPLFLGDSEEAHAKAEHIALLIAKILVPIIGLAALWLSLKRPPSLTLLTQIGNSGLISGVIAPLTLGYFWTRANRPGAIASYLAGVGVYAYFMITKFAFNANPFKSLVIATIAGFVAMLIVSSVTAPMEKEATKFIPSQNK